MAKLTKESFIQSLKEMNIKEVMELVNAMKEEFGIDPSAVVVAGGAAGGAEVAEKTEVTITLKNAGGNKVPVIKKVREISPELSLMDAKKLVDSAPAKLKDNVKPEEAEEIKAAFAALGAEISID
ncbi:50S ribosomal protein L7/L12 [[Mycoplasma] mobile]|uniref:Large ribosomal subunit protein bL12 n=1 Tax=Mycoplasma mobile (strain ATCC 43663 / 163K / NCTC 11711) TaxID=267748 RepID=RL7_MYCM1|nr:50S ribosomal protein L7/L12 [[Mycoplasma] mobile]Q6KHB0.1 RecName: Full=Large ribosomal subunit protein bL12; AltName: Full=50S ribosomal protein L7/L12 [Mycoplasma mobile 163K]AAT28020.1 50S ribosomal protein l7/l12 [Mycoplasma mobile 163K]